MSAAARAARSASGSRSARAALRRRSACACSASNGGAPGAATISSARANGSSSAPRRSASRRRARAPTTRTSGWSARRRRRTPRWRGRRNSLGLLVAAANQVDLRQRVEDGAGRLVKLDRAAALRARGAAPLRRGASVAEPDADLAERRERHRQAVPGAVLLVQRHAALGERERLLVAVLQHRDVRLVAADGRQHVVGVDRRARAARPAAAPAALRRSARLRERDARQRVHEREMAPIAGGVQRRGRLADVLAHDGGVADLLVAAAPARSARGRWRAESCAASPASARGRAARWRATDRRARRRGGRAAARVRREAAGGRCRGRCRAAGRARRCA